jgi:dihydrodipicolinate synthase/N-acetylneuraminate lyase
VLGKVTVMSGNDALMMQFASAGGVAVVSGNSAARPRLVADLFAAARGGDTAAVARRADALTELRRRTGAAPDRLKALLLADGVDVGAARIRTI